MKYKQSDFDKELKAMLAEATAKGQSRLRVVSQDLHNRVRVVRTNDHRMPMACNAMWKLWKQHGCRENRIIHTTDSRKSSTIEIEFDTV